MKHTIEEVTLAQNAKGLFINVPDSDVVSIRLVFRAGYQFGNFDKYEIPHLIEHHILNATKNHPKNGSIEADIASNGAYINASTGPQYITYIIECASFDVERILGLLTEVVTEPLFPAEQYETERENVRTELTRNLSNYARQTSMASNEANFPELVMGYRKRLSQLDSITHEDVVGHYKATHSAANSNFVLSGAIEPNRAVIEAKLIELFTGLPEGERRELWDGKGKGAKTADLIPEKIDSIYFELNWYADGISDQDKATGGLLGSILTGGFASRIYGKAREAGLTYHVTSGASGTKKASSFGFDGFCNQSKLVPLIELITTELTDIVANGPTQTELDEARKRVSGGILLGRQTATNLVSWYQGRYLFDGVITPYEDYFERLAKVTPPMVQAIAAHYLTSSVHSATLLGAVEQVQNDLISSTLASIWL